MAAAVGEINERNQNEIVPSIRPLGGGTLSPGLIQITKKHNATDFITLKYFSCIFHTIDPHLCLNSTKIIVEHILCMRSGPCVVAPASGDTIWGKF